MEYSKDRSQYYCSTLFDFCYRIKMDDSTVRIRSYYLKLLLYEKLLWIQYIFGISKYIDNRMVIYIDGVRVEVKHSMYSLTFSYKHSQFKVDTYWSRKYNWILFANI